MSDRTKQSDLDELDSLEAQLPRLIASGELKEAARRAIVDQLARGIPVTFQRGNVIVKVYPDGHEEILGQVPQGTYRIPPGVTVVETR